MWTKASTLGAAPRTSRSCCPGTGLARWRGPADGTWQMASGPTGTLRASGLTCRQRSTWRGSSPRPAPCRPSRGRRTLWTACPYRRSGALPWSCSSSSCTRRCPSATPSATLEPRSGWSASSPTSSTSSRRPPTTQARPTPTCSSPTPAPSTATTSPSRRGSSWTTTTSCTSRRRAWASLSTRSRTSTSSRASRRTGRRRSGRRRRSRRGTMC
mmetsp:Transcript_44155/g.127739  ORF Transcript_44155/g.127739 Transcript_44155/m.127739 type:complete len:213 (-) Transcript_44155:390-1028(-)